MAKEVDMSVPVGGFSDAERRIVETNVRDAAGLEDALGRFGDPRGFQRAAARGLVETLTLQPAEQVEPEGHLSLDHQGVRALEAMLRTHPAYGSGLPELVLDLGGDGHGEDALRGAVADLIVAGGLATAGLREPSTDDFDIVFHLAAGADAFSGLLRDVLGRDPLSVDDLLDRFRPPKLTDLMQDLARRTCMLGVQDALREWGLAGSASRGEAWSTGIRSLSPNRGCGGTKVTITGSGFGDPKPADVAVAFPRVGGGCSIGTVVSWSDTKVVAVAPPNVGRGCVGFIRLPSGDSGNLAAAASQLAGELEHCFGKAAFNAARRIETIGARPHAPCPPCLPAGANRFDGGPPEIRWFGANGKEDVTIAKNDQLLLEWDVVDATTIAIVPLQVGSVPNDLPTVPGPLNPASGTFDAGLITAGQTWDGEYELRAWNTCSGPFTPVTRRVKVRMRARHALTVTGIEATQATQFFSSSRHMLNSADWRGDNTIPLLGGKTTLVRVFVASGVDDLFDGGLLPGVRGLLHGFDATGKPLPGSPLAPLNAAATPSSAVTVTARRSNAAAALVAEERMFPSLRSFSFLLPASWAGVGSIQVRAEVAPPAGVLPPASPSKTSLAQTLTFQPGGLPLRIALLPVGYADPTMGVTTAAPTTFQTTAELDQVQRVYPTTRSLLNIIPAPGTNPWTYGGDLSDGSGIACGRGLNDIIAELAVRAFFTLGFEDRVWVGLLDGPAITAAGSKLPPTFAGCGAPMSSLGIAYLAGSALAAVLTVGFLGPLGAAALSAALARLGTCALGVAVAIINAPPARPTTRRSITDAGLLAQEIGHGFGLFHVAGSTAAPPYEGSWPDYESGTDNDPSTPYQSIGEFGTEVDDFLGLPPIIRSYAPRALNPFPTGTGFDPHTDYMAYSSRSDWTSPFMYLKLMAGTTVPAPPSASGPMPGPAPSAMADHHHEGSHDEDDSALTSLELLERMEPAEPIDVALVRGDITDAGVRLHPLYVQRRALRLIDVEESPYRAELLDEQGKPLAANAIVPLVDWHEGPPRPSFAFALALPWREEVARVVVTHDGQELAAIEVPREAPRLEPPLVRSTEEGLEVEFKANHERREDLRYLVRFAVDDERQWQLAALDLADGRCVLPHGSVPSGKACRIQVGASVGGRTTWAESEPFEVEPAPPELLVLAPQEGASFSRDEEICLRAEAVSREDGTLPENALRWRSDIDGELGTGRLLMVELSPGRHVVAVTATSSAGAERTQDVVITVEERSSGEPGRASKRS
jgi:hypothetical protein